MAFLSTIETRAGTIGLWELTEDSAYLSAKFIFSQQEKKDFEKIKHERRKREFLAVRMLLEAMMRSKTEIEYDVNGKPLLPGIRLNISISHSAELAVVILSKKNTGIDVENTGRNITPAARRFLTLEELEYTSKCNNSPVMQILYWSAKEAIYKCIRLNNFTFGTQIDINPFKLDSKSGSFTGKVTNDIRSFNFSLGYFFYKNNVVVYCVEE